MTFDFDGIVQEVKNRLSLLSNWQTTLYYGTYERLIEAVCYGIDRLVYLAEFFYRESNWTTALKTRSLLLKAKFLKYTPHRKIAASGNLIITGDSTGFFNNYTNTNESVIIYKWNEFTDTNGTTTVFCTTDTTYAKNDQTIKQLFSVGSISDEGDGLVGLPVSSTNGFVADEIIKVAGTSNYNGYHTIDSIETNAKIIIPATYIAETTDGTEYAVAGLTYIPVKQGVPKSYTYKAVGDVDETIVLYSDSIDNDEIKVYIVDAAGTVLYNVSVIGVDTEEESAYLLTDPDNYYCEIYNDYDFESVKIQFGDDIHTKKLAANTYVLIKYAETDGDEGNIENTGTINTIKTALLDGNGNEVADLYVTNDELISDGSATEDIESIRENAVNLFGTGYRCSSYYDWQNVLNANSTIYNSIIWTTDDIADDTITANQNKVYVSAISSSGDALTESQKADIATNYLKEKKSPTEIISWTDPVKIYAMVKVNAVIKTISKSATKTAVYEAMNDNYGVFNTNFNSDIYESNFIKAIDDLTSYIWYHNSELYNCEKLTSNIKANYPISVYYDSTTSTEQINLVEDSAELWVKTKSGSTFLAPTRIASDVSGSWVVDSGFLLSSANIDYATSEVSFNIYSGLVGTIDTDYELYLSYKTKDGNADYQNDIRLPYSYYITDVDEDFIFIADVNGNSTLTYKSSL